MSEELESKSTQKETEPAILAAQNVALRLKQTSDKIQHRLHCRFPNQIPDPHDDERAYFAAKDLKDNSETLPEDGIELQLSCIEVSEIYGPNEIDSLYKNLLRLGWDRDELLARESNISWLKKQRLYGSEGTLPLGFIHRSREAASYLAVRYRADFPDAFSFLIVNISQLSPSVTCLTVGFVLRDENSFEYYQAIKLPQRTTRFHKKGTSGYWIKGVAQMKSEHIDKIRNQYRSIAIAWLNDNVPGFFSQRCEAKDFPTSEIIVFKGYTPFDKEDNRKRILENWARFLRVNNFYGSWISTSTPSLRFSFEAMENEDLPNHILVGLRSDTLEQSDANFGEGRSLTSLAYFASNRLAGITSRYALICYLREILREIKVLRQTLGSVTSNNGSAEHVKKITSCFQRSIGIPAVAREVLALSKNADSSQWNSSGFLRQSFDSGKADPFDISFALQARLKMLSNALLDDDKDTRELLSQISNAVSTNKSIAVQQRMEIVAFVAAFVSVITLVFTVFWDKN